MNSAWECFHLAALELVRSTPIKHRLVGAYRRHLAEVREDQLPREIRDPFNRIMRCLRNVRPLPGEDEVTASVRKMSNQEADECAALIVDMFGVLSGACAPKSSPSATVVTLHTDATVLDTALESA